MADLGRMLVVFGVLIVVVGLVLMFAGRIPLIGRLPGDIVIQRDGFTCAFPIATMILLSILLTIILSVLARLGGR